MKVARGFVGCVRATGGEVGAGIWRLRSPEGGGAGRPSGVDHRRLTAALGGDEANGRREGERGGWVVRAAGEEKKKKKKKKKRRKEKEKEKKK